MSKDNAIHAMNNHLMVILGNLELLGSEVVDPMLKVSVDDAMEAAEKAIEIVADLRQEA